MIARVATGAEQALHLIARVGAERFAFPVSHVEEALDAPRVEWVPVAPDGMLGQLRHRDRMVGAWDAGWAFRLARPVAAGAALVLRDGTRRIALIVDDVEDIVRIEAGDVRAVAGTADPDGVLRGVHLLASGSSAIVNVVRAEALAARVISRGVPAEGVTP